MTEFKVEDVSRKVFGKYQYCTRVHGLWYSDEDFVHGYGMGTLKWGAIPAPSCSDRRPWRGVIVEYLRRLLGAQREQT